MASGPQKFLCASFKIVLEVVELDLNAQKDLPCEEKGSLPNIWVTLVTCDRQNFRLITVK